VAIEPMVGPLMIDTKPPSGCAVNFSQKPKVGQTRNVVITVASTDLTSGIASREIISITPASGVTGPALSAPSGSAFNFSATTTLRAWEVTGRLTDKAGNVTTCKKTLFALN
jgi:hypothetical protein